MIATYTEDGDDATMPFDKIKIKKKNWEEFKGTDLKLVVPTNT